MNHEHTIYGIGPAKPEAANTNDNTATREGRRIYGAALKACAELACYAQKRGNDELQGRAERALSELLAGQCKTPVETTDDVSEKW